MAARQASSPWVKVVSMPEPEKFSTRTCGACRALCRSAPTAAHSRREPGGQPLVSSATTVSTAASAHRSIVALSVPPSG